MRFDVRKSAIALTITAALAGSALAADQPKLTILDCQTILSGLNALDGRPEMSKDGSVVHLSYQFGSAKLRLTIQQNIAALLAVQADFEKVRMAIFKEIAGDAPEIKPSSPEAARFQKMIGDAQAVTCPAQLQRINAADLKLDKNEIPGSVLASLDKILDR